MPLRASDLPPELATRLGLDVRIKRSKYGAVKQTVDGERFDSCREARRWQELRMLERIGEIGNLQRQPQYLITHEGVVVAVMTLDFRYTRCGTRAWVVEDVKGGNATKTQVYRLRKVLVENQYGVRIEEV